MRSDVGDSRTLGYFDSNDRGDLDSWLTTGFKISWLALFFAINYCTPFGYRDWPSFVTVGVQFFWQRS